jgi:hypothetical protein
LFFCVKEDNPYKTVQDFMGDAKTKMVEYATHGEFRRSCEPFIGRRLEGINYSK